MNVILLYFQCLTCLNIFQLLENHEQLEINAPLISVYPNKLFICKFFKLIIQKINAET